MLNGLAQINIELSSRCNKACFFCGHQNPKVNVALVYGDIAFRLLSCIAEQLPPGIVVQFHRDGEPLVYPWLGDALWQFRNQIRSIVTNGKLLLAKADQIIGNCDSVCISAFAHDPDGAEQIAVAKEFLEIKGDRLPRVIIKIVGDIATEQLTPYVALGVPIIRRVLHSAKGDWSYRQRTPTIPEIGICLDLLHHPSIDWRGNVFICNRLQPENKGLLGNLHDFPLDELWNSEQRKAWIREHIFGRRDAVPACVGCEFYGVPTG